MMNFIAFDIIAIACLVSIACALPGVFLVLRGIALMGDAISHAILLGIIVMFLFVQRLDSIWLIIGASIAGLLTVVCTEVIIQTRRLKKDAAIGLVFPLFFSIGVILISQYARNVHLDLDMVLLGELAFAPFNRLIINDFDLGPYALWAMSGIVFLNCFFIRLFYKELQLITFDQDFAYVIGVSPAVVYYGLMSLTSITSVGAFDAVGSIVVVALMITPPSTAYLLTKRLSLMVGLSAAIGIICSITGYFLASQFDVSIAGSIATMAGVIFVGVLIFSPSQGLLAHRLRQKMKKKDLAQDILLTLLISNVRDGGPYLKFDTTIIVQHLGWQLAFFQQVLKKAHAQDFVLYNADFVMLTESGHNRAKKVLHSIGA